MHGLLIQFVDVLPSSTLMKVDLSVGIYGMLGVSGAAGRLEGKSNVYARTIGRK